MSEKSDEELIVNAGRQATEEAAAAVRNILDLSDDESEDDRKPIPAPRPPTPSPDREVKSEEEEKLEPSANLEQDLAEPVVEEDREITPDITDKYERYAGKTRDDQSKVHILHFPPSVSFHMSLATKLEELPVEQNPILFRLKPNMKKPGQSDVKTILDFVKNNPDPFALKEILNTNAHLITWSDGSKTITIGDEQFLLIDDVIASKHFIFRRGDRIQNFEAHVNSVSRVQPTSTGSAIAKMSLTKSTDGLRQSRFGPKGRKMMRCMDDGGEMEEEKAKQDSLRRQRERLRMEAKRRQARERTMRPARGLTTAMLESNDEDSGEDEKMRRIEERVGESRLLRAKRTTPPPRIEVSVKRRKAGGRRVLSNFDDGDDDESE